MEVCVDQVKRGAWEELCDAMHAPLQQRWAYGETIRRLGGDVLRVTLRDGRRVVAVAQVVRRFSRFGLALVSRGPIWLGDLEIEEQRVALKILRSTLRRSGTRMLITTPATAQAAGIGMATMTPATIATVALCDGMRARLRGKWRNRLVCAEARDLALTLRLSRGAEHDWLFQNEVLQQKSRGYRNLPHPFSEAWLAEPAAQTLTITSDRGDARAGMMFLRHGSTATYHLGWTSDEARRVSAHTLMLWRAMEALHKDGVERLDLGILDTERTPGLARFKLGTGAEPHQLGATHLSL
ncbi:MAG: GNAT family N-acetyltransferase [Pseudomonadota bacterium]